MSTPTDPTPRLLTLRASLAKKEAEFDRRIAAHFADVKSANGQPLNDKRNGTSTIGRWERQDNALCTLKQSIERTKRAIEREEAKIADVAVADVPQALRDMVERGELNQWRKHPNTFFVPGVDKARIVWDSKTRMLGVRYLSACPKDQYPLLRDTFNKARAAIAGAAAA